MKFIKITFIFLICTLSSEIAFADNAQMNDSLVRMVNQIDAMMPLITEAEAEQDKNTPVQFHFEKYTTPDGVTHTGLRDDLLEIRASLIEQINAEPIAPRAVTPISGDYRAR